MNCANMHDTGTMRFILVVGSLVFLPFAGGCAVVTVADAAVSVAATVVKAGANVVGGAVDVARAGVRAATGSNDNK
jgi:hypothetical protein